MNFIHFIQLLQQNFANIHNPKFKYFDSLLEIKLLSLFNI